MEIEDSVGTTALAAQRRQVILETVRDQGGASVRELASLVGVSPSTVRRDLRWLERRDLLARTWGGGVPTDTFGPTRSVELPLGDRQQENRSAKQAIAAAAARLVSDGDVIVVDAGSTTELMAPYLMEKHRLTVMTNSLPLAWALRGYPDIELIVIGGRLQPNPASLTGMLAEHALSQLYADIAFVGARGLRLPEGLTNPLLDEIPVKRRMITIAKRAVALVDSSKWGLVFLGLIGPISSVGAVITDAKAPLPMRREIELAGTEVIIADAQVTG